MSALTSAKTIAKMKKNKEYRESVMAWIVAQGIEKGYKKCTANLSKDCMKVGHIAKFHGKKCPECVKVYKVQLYHSNKENQ